jgi:hypothetical protein
MSDPSGVAREKRDEEVNAPKKRRLLIGILIVTAIAVVATGLLVAQGGFGGGHGSFDQVLFVLSLPWSMVPWPEPFTTNDFTWLVVLPFFLNLAVVAVLSSVGRGQVIWETPL